MRLLALVSAAATALPLSCHAAMLRPFSQITASAVHLADLFDNLGATPDRVLGAAPLPGARIVVDSPQLAAIARDFDVDWRPASGGERVVIERRGDVLSVATIEMAVRRSLQGLGAPEDADLIAPAVQPVMVPAGSSVVPDVSQPSYDAQSGHFTALMTISPPGMEPVQLRLSGQVVPMARTAVAAHVLTPGTVIGPGDLQTIRVRLANLHGGNAMLPESALGFSVRRSVASGQPIGPADLMRPPLVARGALVRMTLRSDGIALSAQGIAAESGAQGDRIRVENPVSHIIVEGEVTGPGEVRVAPRGATISLVSAQ
jgi:flagella basal body P-ring formation protein FlgA